MHSGPLFLKDAAIALTGSANLGPWGRLKLVDQFNAQGDHQFDAMGEKLTVKYSHWALRHPSLARSSAFRPTPLASGNALMTTAQIALSTPPSNPVHASLRLEPTGSDVGLTSPGSNAISAPAGYVTPSVASGGGSASARASLPSGIRPMALGPAGPQSAVNQRALLPMGTGGGGGGGTENPYMLLSGGGDTSFSGTGTVNEAQLVPIGAFFAASVEPPQGSGLTISSVTWSGLGTSSGFISSDPSQPPPSSVNVPSAPVLNTQVTQFLVDSPQTNYVVQAKVTYTNNDTGTTTITFTSAGVPTANMAVPTFGTPTAFNLSIVLHNNGAAPGIDITADTSYTFAGNYMFLQVANMLRQYQDTTGKKFQLASGGPAIDNGGDGNKNNTLGMETIAINDPGLPAFTSWSLAANKDLAVSTQDTPFQSIPTVQPAVASLSVGGLNGSAMETFTTYMMYQPTGLFEGDWIGVGNVTWGWGATGPVGANGQFSGPLANVGTQQPVPTQPLMGNPQAFPSWQTTTSAVVAAGWKPA